MTVPISLGRIADALGGELNGSPELTVDCVCPVEAPLADGICVIWDDDAAARLAGSAAAAVVAPPDVEVPGKTVIRVADPRAALVDLIELLHPRPRPPQRVENGAVVAADARCADDVYLAAGARVESGAILGSGVEVHANSYVGRDVVIGECSVIHPNVTLYHGTRVGRRVVIHSGSVVGSDGFGYLTTQDGRQRKIPQVGVVVIEDDVEIGAGTTIDRATLGRTVIRRGTKIDNQVQIAHNCDIGEDCCIVAQVGVAGTARLGDRCMIGGQAGILDHVTVGPAVRVAAQAGVMEDAPSGEWMGAPAIPAARCRRVAALSSRLPDIYDEVRALRKRCRALEEQLALLGEARER